LKPFENAFRVNKRENTPIAAYFGGKKPPENRAENTPVSAAVKRINSCHFA
jgi:hypothetical protein